MKTLLTLLITFMLGGVFSYWFLGPDSGHDDLLEATAEDDDDDNELAIGSGTGDVILYVTIGAIAASIGYTGFKILKSKRPMVQKSK